MYEIKGIDGEKLKQHVGRRVQIEGTFEDVDPNRPAPDKATSADDLVETQWHLDPSGRWRVPGEVVSVAVQPQEIST